MLNVIVSGAAGRMGSRIIALSKDNKDLKIIGALEHSGHNKIGADVGEINGLGHLGVKLESEINNIAEKADVLIEFSNTNATLEHVKIANDKGISMVIGTTGFSKEEIEQLKTNVKKIPCVLAPNMSVGVNLLLKVIRDVSKVLGDDYDVEIIEAHHRFKKDAPSGTAIKMAQVIAEALNRKLDDTAIYTRKGFIGERTKKEIGIQTIRAGDIVGEHTVLFGGLGERIEITHKASSRDTFALGALKAALWIFKQPPGLYDMQDVLGLK